jgi:FkbM family methyltransferase
MSPAGNFIQRIRAQSGGSTTVAEPAPTRSFEEADPNKLDVLRFAEIVMRRNGDSTSQLGADFWALFELDELRDGYFVEFGAGDGYLYSNTWLLEAHYGWSGILAEPNATIHEQLRANRPNCLFDPRAVYREGGQTLSFVVTDFKELSALSEFAYDGEHAEARRGGTEISVETVTLDRLLDEHDAPDRINYLSLDTEGGELGILEGFDFAKRSIDLISVEHSFAADREAIHELLVGHGYERRFVDFSKFDDWYVSRAVLKAR